jgi:hypothetical protein
LVLVKRNKYFEKPGVGVVVFQLTRFPFRIFTRLAAVVLFKPDFPNAGLYKLNLDVVDLEKLMAIKDAYEAMAYLRSVDKDLAPTKAVLGLVSP